MQSPYKKAKVVEQYVHTHHQYHQEISNPLSVQVVGVTSGGGAGGAGGVQQLKLKEKLHVRKLELVDRPDHDVVRRVEVIVII
ncbi:hypothetical protein MSG28_015266 [Choristoneura fumiferana]|uniref:Uncharacterized protein n=1 Tax=Choristoneura fumiferana TaxID=7141 RepID=A0ACC0K9N7_CHOFU|nr:hypothetical protein MSG28_015266 [Choristoneura fumiferana]